MMRTVLCALLGLGVVAAVPDYFANRELLKVTGDDFDGKLIFLQAQNSDRSLTAFKVHNSLQIVAVLVSYIGTHYGLYGAVRSSYRAFLVLPIATIFATGFSVYGMTFFLITVGESGGKTALSGFSFVGLIVAQSLLLFSGIIGIIYSLLPKY